MKRCVRVAIVSLLGALYLGAASARAQTATPAGSDRQVYVELTAGPTLGHKSDASIGGEFGWRLGSSLDLFFEGGHVGNAATTDFEARGIKIANSVSTTANSVTANAFERVNYFDVGVRYRFTATPRVHPYVAAGFGVGRVTTLTDFALNGTTVPAESLGIQLGGDLSGTFRRPFGMFGLGTNIDFDNRYFADVSYRYGRVSGQATDSETELEAVPTQRIQFGVGIRF
jgi:opacity protein-like surface antigen